VPASACLSPEELAALARGALTGAALERAAAHVDACPACLAAAEGSPPGDAPVATLCRAAAESGDSGPGAGGRYLAVRLHATGGLGEVFAAEDTELGRRVALKRVLPARADDPGSRRRFLREAAVTARLEHPGVVPVYGLVWDPAGRPQYAMRFVAGESLHQAVRALHGPGGAAAEGRLALRGLLQRFVAVCQTVAYAHSKGVVHRDIKPANVMLGPYGETLLVDWGLAKPFGLNAPPGDAEEAPSPDAGGGSTRTGFTVGTPAYMSPEQAAGRHDEVGPASDVFGLGATLHAILTGRAPAEGTVTPGGGRVAPPALEAVCRKAMARRPADRYPSAAEVGAEVERWLAGEPVGAYPERWPARARRWARKHRGAVAAVAAVLAVAAALGGAAVRLAGEAADRRDVRARLAEKDRTAAARALAELPGLVGAWRFREAEGLLDQTALGLSEFAPPGTRDRLGRALADIRLAERLDAVRLEKSALVEGRLETAAVAVPAYRAAFARHGLDCDAGDEAALGEQVAASPVREALLAALDDWAAEEPDAGRRGRLTRIAGAADPGPQRGRLRDALARRDRAALRELARQADVGELTPAALVALALALEVGTREAEDLLRRAQGRSPGDFWLNFYLAIALERGADRGGPRDLGSHRAVGYYRACLAARPQASIVYNNLGGSLHDLKDLAGAADAYRRALAIDPRLAKARLNLGNVVRDTGDMAGAAAEYRRATELDPRFDAGYTNLGNALLELGDPAGAAAAHRRAAELIPDEPRAHNNLGNTLHRLGDLSGAEAAYRRAVGLDPRFAAAHTNLGNTLGQRGDLAGAADAFRRAVAADPGFAGGFAGLGNSLHGLGDLAGAEAAYRRATQLDPRHARAHAALGKTLQERGDRAGAAEACRQAADLTPNDPEALKRLANALAEVGRFDEARSAAQRALDLLPPDRPGRDELAAGIRRCELMVRLEPRLPAVLRGEDQPADAAEHRSLAELAALKGRPAAAARLYAGLLRTDPPAEGNPGDVRRYKAACAAALAGCGRAADGPPLADGERARWRTQALDWLRAELAVRTARLAAADPKRREAERRSLRYWQADPDLAGLREPDGLAALPAAERDAWRRFWVDVAAAMRPRGQ
jgi:serine/threonine-protein kinase